MSKTIKRVLSLCLAMALAVSLTVLPASASGSSPESTARADRLLSLNLFRGTASGYQLDNVPTRLHGLIMLTRLLGLEEEALACEEPSPFTDTDSPYAVYGYRSGLTSGTSADTFSPNDPLSGKHYATFLLRALGYDDSKGDFTFASSLDFAAGIGMMTQDAAARLAAVTFNRGDMVDLSYAALTCRLSGENRTLAEKLAEEGIFTAAQGEAAGVLGANAGWTYSYVPYDGSTIDYETHTVATSGGNVTAHILTVNTKNPKVTVRTALVNNTLGATAPFSQIVQGSGAAAVINGNFFNSYDAFKTPIGHVMVDGQFLFGNSGISSLGITRDGDLRVGRPALFTRIKASNGIEWSAYEINTANKGGSVLFTPAYGASVSMPADGHVMTVAGGTVTGYQAAGAGTAIAIPSNGYVLFMAPDFTGTEYYHEPVIGDTMTMEYYLFQPDAEGFTLDNVVSIVSGAPRLVQDGAIVTTLEGGFQEARFTTSSGPRTAVGVNAAGKLVLVSVPGATIQQMRELMLALGCVDAINLDGGGSCAMYYGGQYLATPGRELTVTLQVHVKK